jgi:hypothetical protein
MKRASSLGICLLIASIPTLYGCKSAPPTKPSATRHLIELACRLPQPPADRTLAATTVALIDALQVVGECRAAALAE